MEYIELNSLRKDTKKARSSQASISINICIELSKTFFPSEYRQVTETSAADIKKPTSLTKSCYVSTPFSFAVIMLNIAVCCCFLLTTIHS